MYFQPQKIAQELSDLVVYCQPMGVKAFENARETGDVRVYFWSRLVYLTSDQLLVAVTELKIFFFCEILREEPVGTRYVQK